MKWQSSQLESSGVDKLKQGFSDIMHILKHRKIKNDLV